MLVAVDHIAVSQQLETVCVVNAVLCAIVAVVYNAGLIATLIFIVIVSARAQSQ
jgi:hypothetical protein